jgi:hypothetical protein
MNQEQWLEQLRNSPIGEVERPPMTKVPKRFPTAPLRETDAPYYGKMRIIESSQKRPGTLCSVEVETLQRSDVKNGNRRIYPRSVWERTFSNPAVTEKLRQRRMVGELDHPESGQTSYARVSHVMTEAKLGPDGSVSGKLDVLDTPNGRILDALVRAEVTVGISSRGDGSTHEGDEDGTTIVDDDFVLETWDIVVNPSTPGAFLGLAESQERTNKMAAAIEALVNGTQDLRVLSESYTIINELIESDKSGKFKIVREKLDNKLKELAGVQPPVPQPSQENHMDPNTTAAEIAAGAQRLAATLVETQISTLKKEHTNETARIQNIVNDQALQLGEFRKREKAAVGLIEQFQYQNRKLRESASASPSGDSGKVQELTKKLDACKGLLEAALKAIEKLKGNTMKAEAAERLVAAMFEHIQRGRLKTHVEKLLRGNPNAGRLRGILESMGSIRKVNESYTNLSEMTGRQTGVREPLPGSGARPSVVRPLHVITEGSSGPTQHRDGVVDTLVRRMGPGSV